MHIWMEKCVYKYICIRVYIYIHIYKHVYIYICIIYKCIRSIHVEYSRNSHAPPMKYTRHMYTHTLQHTDNYYVILGGLE